MFTNFFISEKVEKKLCDKSNYIYENCQDNSTKTKPYGGWECFYKGCKALILTPFECDVPEIIFRSGSHMNFGSNGRPQCRN